MIEAAVGVVLLAGKEVRVLGGAGLGNQVTEGVIVVAISDCAGAVGEQARGTETVEVIPMSLPAAFHADQVVGIDVGRDQRVVGSVFGRHLRQAAVGVDQVFDRCRPGGTFDPVAVDIVGVGRGSRRTGNLHHPVVVVIAVECRPAAVGLTRQTSVQIVGVSHPVFADKLVGGIVAVVGSDHRCRCRCRCLAQPVADGVIDEVGGVALRTVRINDLLLGQAVGEAA